MRHHSDNWFSRHFITHHHVIADRLLRFVVAILGIGIIALVGVAQFNARSLRVRVVITPTTTPYLHQRSLITVDLTNERGAIKSGLVITFSSSPSLRMHTLDAQPFPGDGIAYVRSFPVGAQSRYVLLVEPETIGEHTVSVSIRRENSPKVIASAVQTITIEKPRVSVKASARYYTSEGEQLGRGPLPPRVGETTTYYGVLQFPFEGYVWKKVTVTGVLGDRVDWGDFVPEGAREIHYDPVTRRVSWQVNSWPAADEIDRSHKGTVFALRLTPAKSDIATTPVLLHSMQVNAVTDSGDQFSGVLPDITTELIGDVRASGKGAVEP